MKVKLLSQYCGPRGSFAPGHVIDVPVEEAGPLIEGGYAEDAEPQPKTAIATENTENLDELEMQPPADEPKSESKPKGKGKGKGKK